MAERPPAARVGLLGLPQSGKTSLFCLLTGADPHRVAPQSAVAPVAGRAMVPDDRLERVYDAYGRKPKFARPAIEIYDMPPLDAEDTRRNATVLGQLRTVDGYLGLLNAFSDDADRQMGALTSMLYLADVEVMESRLDSISRSLKRPVPAAEREPVEREREVLKRLIDAVGEGHPEAVRDLSAEDERRLRGLAFFSRKPIVWIRNVAESALPAPDLCVPFEIELAALEPSERAEFLSGYGLAGPAAPALPRLVFDRLDRILFLTHGDDEVAGWPIPRGATAWEAAGKIHTDIQKGFINAEVTAVDEWLKQEGRARPRLEGKEYVVKDGDIVHFRFNR